MDEMLFLTDLIDISILQEMQDSFSKMTGIAAYITDAHGNYVTETSCQSDFCTVYTRTSEEGARRCKTCDYNSSRLAFTNNQTITYHCHAGLRNFAAPITVEGRLAGCFFAGQFLDAPPDDSKIRRLAAEIGTDPAEYARAYQRIPLITRDKMKRASLFLRTITTALSSIAYHNFVILQENAKIKRATSLKSDFLANMSHEIRTPMNAIIGMAEMTLREELPLAAQDYVSQIKSSGKNLLMIINDILDFSKIESGKMEITMGDYQPMSMINDVSNIIVSHIGDKPVELILDISPDIPHELLGDSLRIKQIFVNLCNNAVKFTNSGYITLTCEPLARNENEVIMQAVIQDTGIGIKKADLEKLFQSFQQLDSKRNRNLEGTGLGLAISQRLVHLMMGSIDVESEFGKGSRFSFKLPQRITRDIPAITLKHPPNAAAGLIADGVVHEQLEKDIRRLHVSYHALKSETYLSDLDHFKVEFFFIENPLYTETVEAFVDSHPDITAVVIIGFYDAYPAHKPNLVIVKKPVYSLNLAMIFNGENIDSSYNNVTDEDYEFIAPEAQILIVDDNSVNLTVAEGLLKPLLLQIDTAPSGKEAIKMISIKHYDLIFMDHMMPDLNGIETTHIIRRFHKEYETVPIIAFSANSSTEMEMMFLNEGLNDSVGKPFELRMLISKLKRWLPKEKMQKISEHHFPAPAAAEAEPQPSIQIEGLDTAAALKLIGSEKLLWDVLRDYYRVIRKKAEKIHALEQQEDWKNYTIEVHALKSTSRQIGANDLADLASDMEKAGNAENAKLIHQYTGSMLEQYLHYDHILAPYFMEQHEPSDTASAASPEMLRSAFAGLRKAMSELDMDQMEAVIQKLSLCRYNSWQLECFKQLRNAAEELDVDSCESILADWEKKEAEHGK